MGPNTKQRSRAQYVKYRLKVLRELHIAPPPQEKIDEMLDESRMTEIQVDSVFLGCLNKSRY